MKIVTRFFEIVIGFTHGQISPAGKKRVHRETRRVYGTLHNVRVEDIAQSEREIRYLPVGRQGYRMRTTLLNLLLSFSLGEK